jgi:pyruvate/2-oxoglutarate dehydrogenase complex dihydrolipoamide dehydrogenase (E3) component
MTPDLCIIGAGSAGLSVAAAAALMKVPVVLIEKDRMGGDCLNVGCVPSKALIAAAEHSASARDARRFGIGLGEPRVDFAKVRERVRSVIAAIEPNDSVERFTALGATVIKGEARFRDRRTVIVGDHEIRARRFVIATGSRPNIPTVEGLEALPYLTNETVFDLDVRPERLLILGAGPIGMELAQAFRRLGSEVDVIVPSEPLGREDREAAAIVTAALGHEGVRFHPQARAVRARQTGSSIELTIVSGGTERILKGSHLLVAAGRRVVTDSLALEAAGIRRSEAGITVDKRLKTSNRRVYAIGDCIGGPQFTHAANYHAGLVIRNALFRQPVAVDYAALPRVTFTAPEIAAVGLSESEALKADPKASILRWPFAENDRAQAEGAIEGFVKAVVDRKGRVLGATIVGAHAGELITPWTLLIRKGLPVTTLTDLVFPYPTLSEVSKRAAITYLTPKLRSPWLPRVLKLLRLFG